MRKLNLNPVTAMRPNPARALLLGVIIALASGTLPQPREVPSASAGGSGPANLEKPQLAGLGSLGLLPLPFLARRRCPDGQLPVTGQDLCWDDQGSLVPCAGTGHDGEIQAGRSLAYVDNSDGTITDLNTSLVWEKKSDDGSIHDMDQVYSWPDTFAAHVASLNAGQFAGRDDWRVPNLKELLSIVDHGASTPSVAPAFDTACTPGCDGLTCSCASKQSHWSSTSNPHHPDQAFFVFFNDGYSHDTLKGDLLHLRAVSGGQHRCRRLPATGQDLCWDAQGDSIPCAGTGQDGETQAGRPLAYVDNPDGTIIDLNTGLMWEKKSDDGGIHDRDQVYSWSNVASHAAALNAVSFAGFDDWRMPNAKELNSIVDYASFSPSISSVFHTNCTPGCTVFDCSCTWQAIYWSSTSNQRTPAQAFAVVFNDGFIIDPQKSLSLYVRAVRGGL